MRTIILDIGDKSADWIKSFSKPKIQKAKVYVKTPQDAPGGAKIERGKRGGLYYESQSLGEESTQSTQKPKLQVPEYGKNFELGYGLKYIGKISNIKEKKEIETTYYHPEYDIWQTNNGVNIWIAPNDIPTNIASKSESADSATKYTENKPYVVFLGKSVTRRFKWTSVDGKIYESQYAGHFNAEYGAEKNEIAIYDDENVLDVLPHEVGHFVQKEIMLRNEPLIPDSIQMLLHVDDINNYNKVVEILKNHNVLNYDKIIQILDDKWLEDDNLVAVVRDFRTNNLSLYDEGYTSLKVAGDRIQKNISIEINKFDIDNYNHYKKRRHEFVESNTLFHEWRDIYIDEKFQGNEYAARNDGEAFAEMYQYMVYFLSGNKDYTNIELMHPKKFKFMKEKVFTKFQKEIQQRQLEINQEKVQRANREKSVQEMPTIQEVINMPEVKIDKESLLTVNYKDNNIIVNPSYYDLDTETKRLLVGQAIAKSFINIPSIQKRIEENKDLLGEYVDGKFIGIYHEQTPEQSYITGVGRIFAIGSTKFVEEFDFTKYSFFRRSIPYNALNIMNNVFMRIKEMKT